MEYEAILLDADGVVQWPSHGFIERLEELGGEGFVAESFAAELPTLIGEGDFLEILDEILRRRGRAASASEVHDIWLGIDVSVEVLALVDEVRAGGVPVYLATNQQRRRGEFMRAQLGYDDHFDGQFYSYELGVAKPDPAFYTAILEELALTGDRVIFVDDRPGNVEGALIAGLQAHLHLWKEGAAGLARILGLPGWPT